jgi:hypothetical protein
VQPAPCSQGWGEFSSGAFIASSFQSKAQEGVDAIFRYTWSKADELVNFYFVRILKN